MFLSSASDQSFIPPPKSSNNDCPNKECLKIFCAVLMGALTKNVSHEGLRHIQTFLSSKMEFEVY